MGGGTFFKVGGAQVIAKNLQKMFVVWIGNYDLTSTEIWRHWLLSACFMHCVI